jgi:3-oxoacyl-[acyl-carrier protein] reductase
MPGRIAVVSGGGQGIGRAVALTLAARGDTVIVSARTKETLESVVAEIRQTGGRAYARSADVRRMSEVEALFDDVSGRYGDVGIVVTCAVKSRVAGFMELTDEDWMTHYETKVLGAIRCIREAIPAMRRQRWGRIVNLAGTTARSCAPGRMTNGMTNAAITNISKHLADEFADEGILVNTVHPGYTATPRLDMIVERTATREGLSVEQARDLLRNAIPTQQFTQAAEIANLVAFLCSEDNHSITGQTLAVDGGLARAVTY